MLSETYDTKVKVVKIQIYENGIPMVGDWNDFSSLDSAKRYIADEFWMNLGCDYTIEVTKSYRSVYVVDTIV